MKCEDFKEKPGVESFFYTKDGYNRYTIYHVPGLKIRPIDSDKELDNSIFDNESYYLPLDFNKDKQTFLFKTLTQSDTLTLKYDKRNTYEEECGFRFWVENVSVAEPTSFDSVTVSQATNHVQIYY